MLVSLRVGVLVLLLTPSFLWLFGGDPAICSVVAEQIMATPHDKLHFVYNKFKSAIAYELIQVSYYFLLVAVFVISLSYLVLISL